MAATRHTLALRCYEFAGKQDHLDAQMKAGRMYENGEGTAPDYAMAEDWYTKCAAQGISEAKAALAALNDSDALYAKAETALSAGQQDSAVMWYNAAKAIGSTKAAESLQTFCDNPENDEYLRETIEK